MLTPPHAALFRFSAGVPRGARFVAGDPRAERGAAWTGPKELVSAGRTSGEVVGLVLAAGAGRRMGAPKALVRDASGTPWVVRTVRVVAAAGLTRVVVVAGAAGDEVEAALAGEAATVVRAEGWAEGMGASLRAGIEHLVGEESPGAARERVAAALVCVVDTPGLDAGVVLRVAEGAAPGALARATYDGVPGHPVLIGRDHFAGVARTARADVGARAYLARHQVRAVECADLADGVDVDVAADLPPGHRFG